MLRALLRAKRGNKLRKYKHKGKNRNKEVRGGPVKIPLTNGKFATIDADNYEPVSRFQWMEQNGYSVTPVLIAGRVVFLEMGQLVMFPEIADMVEYAAVLDERPRAN